MLRPTLNALRAATAILRHGDRHGRQAHVRRVAVPPCSLYRLAPRPAGLRVRAGLAWVSWRGADILLMAGQEFRFDFGGDMPLLSAADGRPLTIELLS